MNNLTKITLIFSTSLLSACVNQNKIAEKTIAPVSNPCQKISALLREYENGFEPIKLTNIKAKASNTWKAKYNLVGENCHIWSWGGNKTTYACNISSSNEETAQQYYQNAIKTTKQCLNNEWKVTEEPRNNDDGIKTTFTNKDSKASISAHYVPLDSVFSKSWTIYYYVGKPKV